MVELYTMVLDGREYGVDADLIQWQQDAINGDGMIPIAMQLDFEHRSVEFLKNLREPHEAGAEMAKVPNLVPKGSRKPDTALTDNVGLDPNLTAERAAPVPAKGHRPAGSGRAKISHRQPREYPPKAQTGAGRNTAGVPLQTHQPEATLEILYIREQWVNYYIARENEIHFSGEAEGKMGQKGQK